MKKIIFIHIKEIINFHHVQIEEFGGVHGIRDLGLLESAVAMPEATFNKSFLHSDIFEMAAAYMFHIIKNHPFIDGNKRTGIMTGIVFLHTNGITEFVLTQE